MWSAGEIVPADRRALPRPAPLPAADRPEGRGIEYRR
jgi:hypothetical protein